MEIERPRAFAGRVAAAFLAMIVLTALVLALVALAYCSAPSEKRHLPGAPASAVSRS